MIVHIPEARAVYENIRNLIKYVLKLIAMLHIAETVANPAGHAFYIYLCVPAYDAFDFNWINMRKTISWNKFTLCAYSRTKHIKQWNGIKWWTMANANKSIMKMILTSAVCIRSKSPHYCLLLLIRMWSLLCSHMYAVNLSMFACMYLCVRIFFLTIDRFCRVLFDRIENETKFIMNYIICNLKRERMA